MPLPTISNFFPDKIHSLHSAMRINYSSHIYLFQCLSPLPCTKQNSSLNEWCPPNRMPSTMTDMAILYSCSQCIHTHIHTHVQPRPSWKDYHKGSEIIVWKWNYLVFHAHIFIEWSSAFEEAFIVRLVYQNTRCNFTVSLVKMHGLVAFCVRCRARTACNISRKVATLHCGYPVQKWPKQRLGFLHT